MQLKEMLLPEFDAEMAKTRTALERVPESKFGWKPHEKSAAMGWLAGHLATIPMWAGPTLEQDSFDIAPPEGSQQRPPAPKTLSEVLSSFDSSVAAARAVIGRTTDEQFMKPWSLLAGGRTVFTQPRFAVLRAMVLNHSIHHRAQLGVYLRLNDIAVPATYGPSADESGM